MSPLAETKWLVACSVLLLPLTRAAALELEVGTRLPTEQNEKIIVKNDGGVQTTAINRLRRATVGPGALFEVEAIAVLPPK